MKRYARWCVFIGSFAVSGNAVSQDVRQDTKVIGLYIQSVKKTAEEFKDSRDLIAKAAVRNTNILEEKTLRSEQAVQKEVTVWQITGEKERISLFDALRTAPEQLLAQRRDLDAKQAEHKKLLDAAKSAADFRVDKLAEAAATLAKLGEKRSTSDEVKFYLDFIQQVRKHIRDDLQTNASKAGTMAENDLEQKDIAH